MYSVENNTLMVIHQLISLFYSSVELSMRRSLTMLLKNKHAFIKKVDLELSNNSETVLNSSLSAHGPDLLWLC